MSDGTTTRIGPYEIVRELGRGGMGVVHLARDPRLDREVAIKGLPEELLNDPDRLARFEREARTLASLNHSSIASVLSVEYDDGRPFIVLEYVDGETLEDRLMRGPLPEKEAISIARQMAEALEAAHSKGIIHRDLKPANVKFCADHDRSDLVKVLDFGLAKAVVDRRSDAAADAATVTRGPATEAGVVLGTPGYLSPEQARGQVVDERSDIFSLGCVLYEMLTGRRVFGGATPSDAIAAVLNAEPDWNALPAGLSPIVQRLVRRCLEKDRRQRMQAIGDVRLELEDASSPAAETASAPVASAARRPSELVPWIVVALFAILLTAMLVNRPTPSPGTRPVERWEVGLPDGATLGWTASSPTSLSAVGYSRQITISRDGTRLACAGEGEAGTVIFLKEPDSWTFRPIPGTENARAPFFSPDGESIGFLQDQVLTTMRLPSGLALAICSVITTSFDATWCADHTIIYAADDGLWRVSEDALSAPQPVALADPGDEQNQYRFPHISGDGRWLFLSVVNDAGTHAAMASMERERLDLRVIRRDASDARYVSSGHLVFARGAAVHAARFDPDRPDEIAVAEPIASEVHGTPGHYGLVVSHFCTSDTGVLAYAPAAAPPGDDVMLWVDRETDDVEPIARGAGKWRHPRLSPHDDRILFDIQDNDGTRDLFIFDRTRGQRNQLTHKGSCFNAEWSPDGLAVIYCAGGPSGRDVYEVATDFSGEESLILESQRGCWPHLSSWTRDGTLLFWDRARGGTWSIPADGGELRPLVSTQANERWAVTSPDGTLIAYVADEQDRMEVFVQRYPELGPRLRVTNEGGGEPVWSRAPDALVLYFRRGDTVYAAEIQATPTLAASPPVRVFDGTYDIGPPGHQHYDVARDGRFVMMKEGGRSKPKSVRVISHWDQRVSAGIDD